MSKLIEPGALSGGNVELGRTVCLLYLGGREKWGGGIRLLSLRLLYLSL